MCDTMVALANTTADGSVLFAKNSDRDPNEVHELVLFPAADPQEAQVQCTYIAIPQVNHTYATLLSKPFWIWGGEMGANECGVVIGNEALFSKVPAGKKPGLIGMDFLRLALERGATAEEAAQVIIDLLEEFGQSGNCGYDKPLYYHNSYLIADSRTAYVLETVAKDWALRKVKSIASISNRISIQHDYDRCSNNLIQHAIYRNWCNSPDEFNFQRHYSDRVYTHFADGKRRSCETYQTLTDADGKVTEETLFALLRHHRDGFPSSRKLTGANVCMHAGYGPFRGSQTTGSMVARITDEGVTLWLTGTAAPCTGLFKPIWLESGLPEALNTTATAEFDPNHLWWHHEQLHRRILKDPQQFLPLIQGEQVTAETEWLAQVRTIQQTEAGIEEKHQVTEDCFAAAETLTNQWINTLHQIQPSQTNFYLYHRAWQKWNRKVHFPELKNETK